MLPVAWKFGKRFILTRLPCSMVILFTRIILYILSFNTFPFCLKPFGFLVGRTVFRAVIPADNRVDKASVRSESADGIPKFWKNEKICGRLPASPPTESEASLDVPPVCSTFARENGSWPRRDLTSNQQWVKISVWSSIHIVFQNTVFIYS